MATRSDSRVSCIGPLATAVVAGSMLSGAMISLSTIVIPVLLDTNPDSAHLIRQWVRLYHYGHIILPAACIGTCGLYGWIALSKRMSVKRHQWLRYVAAAVATFTMVPFTWILMTSTNNTLFQLDSTTTGISTSEIEPDFARKLVVKWAWLHITRSLFPLIGAYLGLTGMLREIGM
ncbi:hypothetical protein HD806DRAFT_549174 [Xylariaceae sp. AK1471]|nr:hypothetical protein HD806DRAFT_549174 [Xylariaceae sp. AK1471]